MALEEKRAVIECQGLEKFFYPRKRDPVRAVDGVSLKAYAGEVYGLLGPNGAGKTTTLRVLATILKPTGGEARVAGASVTEDAMSVRKNIGFLSCNTGLYGRLTPREMVRYFGQLYEVPSETMDARVRDIFERFGINDFADRACDKLSSGQKQKVNLARTIIHDPPVLILDEPTSNLDPLAAREVVALINERRAAGACIIFSTHQLYDAERLCDRIGIIANGRLRGEGTLAQICAQTGTETLEAAFFSLADTRPEEAGQ